jgi:holin-like protein
MGTVRTSELAARSRALGRLVLQIAGLYALFRAADLAVEWARLPLPGNIVGMLVLFGLLSAGVVREHWIQEGATFLTKHLAFFFIPIAVGLMQWGPLFQREGLWLLLALMVSTLASVAATGGVVCLISSRGLRRGAVPWRTSPSQLSPSASRSASTR